jgi:hypothetical protein
VLVLCLPEAFRAPIFRTGVDKNGFSLGAYNNFQEVFGDNRACWFVPVFTRYFNTSYFTEYIIIIRFN